MRTSVVIPFISVLPVNNGRSHLWRLLGPVEVDVASSLKASDWLPPPSISSPIVCHCGWRVATDDAERCSSRAVELSPVQPWRRRHKLDVYNEVPRRLRDREDARLPGFEDELWAHFRRLPARHALDVNVEGAQDALMDERLLQMAVDPANRPAFDNGIVQLGRSKWNGHIGASGMVLRLKTPLSRVCLAFLLNSVEQWGHVVIYTGVYRCM